MSIAYLGPAGTFTEIALSRYDPKAQRVPLPSIRNVFEAVASGDFSRGFVPHENMIDGIVTQTLDNLVRFSDKAHVVGATMLPIELSIGAHPESTSVQRVYSKDKAIGQCGDYLRSHFPEAELIPVGSTAGAMNQIIQEGLIDAAAIGFVNTLHTYGLSILDENIADERENRTRFFEIAENYTGPTGNDITPLCIYPKRDRQGILLEMLTEISEEFGLNMTSIHSRPDRKGGNRFFIDVEGHYFDSGVSSCIKELSDKLPDTEVTVLGSHPNLPFREPLIKTLGIIGGEGKMGTYLGSFFRDRAGYNVIVHDVNTELSLVDCVEQSDAVMISVPIEVSSDVVGRVAPLMKPGQLLFDNVGVKDPIVSQMVNETADGVEIGSFHTMFGPDIEDMSASVDGKNIISIPNNRHGPMAQEIEDALHKHGGNIHSSSVEDHDNAASITQSLEHVESVVKLAVIRRIAGQDNSLDAFDTPNSSRSKEVYSKIHYSSPHLLGMMLRSNPRALSTLETYAHTFNDVVSDLKSGSSALFERLMKENKGRKK